MRLKLEVARVSNVIVTWRRYIQKWKFRVCPDSPHEGTVYPLLLGPQHPVRVYKVGRYLRMTPWGLRRKVILLLYINKSRSRVPYLLFINWTPETYYKLS